MLGVSSDVYAVSGSESSLSPSDNVSTSQSNDIHDSSESVLDSSEVVTESRNTSENSLVHIEPKREDDGKEEGKSLNDLIDKTYLNAGNSGKILDFSGQGQTDLDLRSSIAFGFKKFYLDGLNTNYVTAGFYSWGSYLNKVASVSGIQMNGMWDALKHSFGMVESAVNGNYKSIGDHRGWIDTMWKTIYDDGNLANKHLRADISTEKSRVDSLSANIFGGTRSLAILEGNITKNRGWIDDLWNVVKDSSNSNSRLRSEIDDVKANIFGGTRSLAILEGNISKNRGWIDDIWKLVKDGPNSNAKLREKIDEIGNNIYGGTRSLATLEGNITKNRGWIDDIWKLVKDGPNANVKLRNELDEVKGNIYSGTRSLATLEGNITKNRGWIDDIWALVKDGPNANVKLRNELDDVKSNIYSGTRSLATLDNNIKKLQDSQKAQDLLITAGGLKDVDQDLAIKTTEDSLFSLTGRMASLEPEVRTIKEDIKKLSSGMTQAEHHQNLAYFFQPEGYFGKFISDLFEKYFCGSDDVTKPTGIFTKWLYLGLKVLVQNFLDIKEAINKNFESMFVKLDWLENINLNLDAINKWVQNIFDKIGTGSGPSVVVPPFDFERLQNMLDGLNFGNIVNEAGTNIWDFLSELVKSIGKIMSDGFSNVTRLIQSLLDFFDSFLDKLIGLIVPKNWDFLENGFGDLKGKISVKFGSFIDLGGKVKDVFKPKEGDFFKALNFEMLGVQFDFTGGKKYLDNFVPKFRLLMSIGLWLSTAVWVYKKITGSGDVIAD